MSDTNFFLTDEFIAFSKNMADLHNAKKIRQNGFAEVKEAFQKQYDEYKAEMQKFDAQANALVAEWENWKSSQT